MGIVESYVKVIDIETAFNYFNYHESKLEFFRLPGIHNELTHRPDLDLNLLSTLYDLDVNLFKTLMIEPYSNDDFAIQFSGISKGPYFDTLKKW